MGIATLFLVEAAIAAPIQVVTDAPPQLLLAGYEQCLEREVARRLPDPISAEEVFDESQAQCAFWFDAYVEKLTSTIVMTNIDYQQEKAKWAASVRANVIAAVGERRAFSPQEDALTPEVDNLDAAADQVDAR